MDLKLPEEYKVQFVFIPGLLTRTPLHCDLHGIKQVVVLLSPRGGEGGGKGGGEEGGGSEREEGEWEGGGRTPI